MNHRNLQWLFLSLLALGLGGVAACGGAAVAKRAGGRNIMIFLDLSESVKNKHRTRWAKIGQKQVAGLHYGDSISLFGIHDHTSDSAPFYTGEIPLPPDDAVADDMTEAKRMLQLVRKEALAAFEKALVEPARSMETDVFSAFDRYLPDAARRKQLVIILSDMQQATREVNFERTPLRADEFERIIRSEQARHGWSGRTLAEVKVCVVLPSAEIGQAKPANSVQMLRAFYSALISSLGGELATFDTYLKEGNHENQ